MKTKRMVLLGGSLLLAFGLCGAQQQDQPKEQKPKPTETTQKVEGKKKPPRPRKVPDLSGFDLLAPKKVNQQTVVVGATRGGPRPVALAPRLGKLYGAHPVFAWQFDAKATKFLFVLRDDTQEEVFRTEVAGNTYSYPVDAPPLMPEKSYFWTVEPASTMLASPSSPVGILVVAGRQREEITKRLAELAGHDAYQAGLARARLFTEHRLWYDALAAYTELIAQYPNQAELFEERGMIYAQLEVTQALAQQDFARADELQHQDTPTQ